MANVQEILSRIDEKAPYAMVLEASVRDYCVLALKFLRGEADFQSCFQEPPAPAIPALEAELSARKFADERYCRQLYAPAEEALLADAIADIAFAQAERLNIAAPSRADERERADVYIVAVYTLFALALHEREDFAVLFLESWDNFVRFAGARSIRKKWDRSWQSRYSPLFYPLG